MTFRVANCSPKALVYLYEKYANSFKAWNTEESRGIIDLLSNTICRK